jgi:hypothetical protein
VLGAEADAGVPDVERARRGAAVTTTAAVAGAVVASSLLSASDALVVRVPRAPEAITTVIWMLPRELPAAMGVGSLEVQVSVVSLDEIKQAHPFGVVPGGVKVSPVGRVTTSVGGL